MSVEIDSVTISSIEDRRMVLTNSQAARVINIGTWTRMRVFIRFALNDFGANITGTPRLYVGLLSNPSAGLANGPLTATTSHFVGLINALATWTRNAGPPVYYSFATNTWFAKKIGATITTTTGGLSQPFLTTVEANRRAIFGVELTKTDAVTTNVRIMNPGTSSPLDVSLVQMRTAIEISLLTGAATYLSGVVGTNYEASANGNVTTNEGVDGVLNAVCVAWDRVNPAIRISDLMWAKMA